MTNRNDDLRTYRLVIKQHTNGLGTLLCYSDPFRVYGDAHTIRSRQELWDIEIERIEEFTNGHWWKA